MVENATNFRSSGQDEMYRGPLKRESFKLVLTLCTVRLTSTYANAAIQVKASPSLSALSSRNQSSPLRQKGTVDPSITIQVMNENSFSRACTDQIEVLKYLDCPSL